MAKINLKDALSQSLETTKLYIDTELAKKADSNHGTHLSLGTSSSTAYRGDRGKIAYDHSQVAHAPSNAQKNSDITKAEIEAKLTGDITTHTHSYLPLTGGTISNGTGLTIKTDASVDKALTIQRGGTSEQTKIYQDDNTLYFDMTNDEAAANIKFRMTATDTEGGDGTGGFSNSTITLTGGKSGSTITATTFSGNATSATKLATTRAIKIGNKSNNFNGSAAITYTLADIGAFPAAGGTITGSTTLTHGTKDTAACYTATRSDTGTSVYLGVGSGGVNHGIYSNTLNKWMVYADANNVYLNGNVNGNAQTATTADSVRNTRGRATSANIAATGDQKLSYMLATGSMTTGKPCEDGKILHMEWDNKNGYSSQLYVGHGATPKLQVRGMNAGTWGEWITAYTTANKPTAADVGAATSGHGHTNYVQGDNTSRTTDQNGNANDITASGFYRVNSTSGDKNPFPENMHSHILHGQHPTTTGYQYQIAFPYTNSARMYFRSNPNSSWGNWHRIYHSGNKPTASEVGALSTAGGTVSGVVKSSVGGGKAAFYVTNGTAKTMVYSSSTVGEHIFGGNNNSSETIIDFIRIGANKLKYETGGNVYDIYHAGNKPSASTIGALATTGGTMTGTIISNVAVNNDILRWSSSSNTSGVIKKVTDQGGVLIHNDSSMFLHAGDSGPTIAAAEGAAAGFTSENIYLSAEGSIQLAVNCQNGYDSATKFTFNTSGFSGNAASASGFKFWSGTQAQYNALSSKDSKTVYMITG